jgi:hypothetical protein
VRLPEAVDAVVGALLIQCVDQSDSLGALRRLGGS